MRISGLQVQNLLKIYGKSVNRTGGSTADELGSAKSGDNVMISGEGKLKHKAIQAVRQTEDIRKDKVDEIKQAVASGTYEVTPEEVAEQMIYRSIVDKLV